MDRKIYSEIMLASKAMADATVVKKNGVLRQYDKKLYEEAFQDGARYVLELLRDFNRDVVREGDRHKESGKRHGVLWALRTVESWFVA